MSRLQFYSAIAFALSGIIVAIVRHFSSKEVDVTLRVKLKDQRCRR